MNLTFFTNLSDKKVLNKQLVHFQYGDDNIVSCSISDDCSVTNPTFVLGSAMFDLSNVNYCYCDYFQRFYFIDNCTIKRNGIVEIKCTVDVLYTFSNFVKNYYGIIRRQENVNLCNKYIVDEKVVGRIDRQIVKKQIGNVGGNATGEHICLTVTGGGASE